MPEPVFVSFLVKIYIVYCYSIVNSRGFNHIDLRHVYSHSNKLGLFFPLAVLVYGLSYELDNHIFASFFPLITILHSVIQILVATRS